MLLLYVIATSLMGNPTLFKWFLHFTDTLGLRCRGLLHWGHGIHTVPPPTGQREAGSLRGVAADQAAAPRPLAGDGLEFQCWQLPALSHREKQPQQGEGTCVVSLPSVGQGNGRAASVSCLRVLSLASVTRKNTSYLAMEAQELCCSLFIRWFCPDSAWRGEGKRRQWTGLGGADVHTGVWPWPQISPAGWICRGQRAPTKRNFFLEVFPPVA